VPPALAPVVPAVARALPSTRAVSAMQLNSELQTGLLPQTVAPRLNAARRPEPLVPTESAGLAEPAQEASRQEPPEEPQRPGAHALPPLTPEDDGLDDGLDDELDEDLDDGFDDEADIGLKDRIDTISAANEADDAREDEDENEDEGVTAPGLSLIPPPALAVARPTADDPELTALAAALFGPRAQTPSHPRPSGRPRPGEGGSVR
jgi:hypothetical protein